VSEVCCGQGVLCSRCAVPDTNGYKTGDEMCC